MDPNKVLAVACRCLFSKQARARVLACSILDKVDKIGPSEGVLDEANKARMTAHLIEKIVKEHK
jgi:hypothetical protein